MHREPQIQVLSGMQDPGDCRPWELDWLAFGPLPHPAPRLREDPEFDGLTALPESIVLDGREYLPRPCRSLGGWLDFRALFGLQPGFPAAFIFTHIECSAPTRLHVRFAADWFTCWWLNGIAVGDSRTGNLVAADDLHFHRLVLALRPGVNLIQVKVGSGVGSWTLRLGLNEAPPPAERRRRCPLPQFSGPLGEPTRDYARTGLRLEYRGAEVPGPKRWREEPELRAAGVQARWIQVVDHLSTPLFPNRALPAAPGADAAARRRLQAWIHRIQAAGMPALSWFWMCYGSEALKAHPDWASQPFPPGTPRTGAYADAHACIHSPFGEAVIAFCVEAVRELGLDGFWFDGSHLSPMRGLGCACRHCRRRFKADTGLPFPTRIDWSDLSFRHWLRWRVQAFSAYWIRLAGAIRRAQPHARVAINHMHRPGLGWSYGCPLDPSGADIIGGTEGSALMRESAFITRLVRAAGYRQTETWMGLHLLNRELDGNPCLYLHHALDCMTAGGMPSFGTDDAAAPNRPTYEALAALVNPRAPWVGGASVPYAALHVSDQAITCSYARFAERDYHSLIPWGAWRSLVGWDHLLAETHCLTEVILDAALTRAGLAPYPLVILARSPALSTAQVTALEQYVEDGGVLVVGPDCGSCDEWGEPAAPNRMKRLLGRRAEPPPAGDRLVPGEQVRIRALGAGRVVQLAGDVGGRFQACRSRQLAGEVAALLHELAPPRLRLTADPNLRVGLFQRPGELLLHLQNGIGYSGMLAAPASPLLQPPAVCRDVLAEVAGFPVRRVTVVAGEGRLRPQWRQESGWTSIRLPRLAWGAVLKLDI